MFKVLGNNYNNKWAFLTLTKTFCWYNCLTTVWLWEATCWDRLNTPKCLFFPSNKWPWWIPVITITDFLTTRAPHLSYNQMFELIFTNFLFCNKTFSVLMFNYIRYEKQLTTFLVRSPNSYLKNLSETYRISRRATSFYIRPLIKGRQTRWNHILQTYYITAANYQFDALGASCSSIHH